MTLILTTLTKELVALLDPLLILGSASRLKE